jgi:serine/threonine protein phosphatase PrpC
MRMRSALAGRTVLEVSAWATATRQGPGRRNEDRAKADGVLFGLADGMGGLSRGDLAAQSALDALHRAAPRDPSALADALHQADDAVRALGARLGTETGATLTALLVVRHGWWLVHVGDTRAWLVLDDATARPCTTDDNAATRLGVGPEDSRYPQLATIVTANLGGRTAMARGAQDLPWPHRRARVVLTSDGVHDHLSLATMRYELLADDPGACARALVEGARRAGSDDDATALVVDVARRRGWRR